MSQNRVSVYAVPVTLENPSGGTITAGGTFSVNWTTDGITGAGWTPDALKVETYDGETISGPNIGYVEGSDILNSEEFATKVSNAIGTMSRSSEWLSLAAFGLGWGLDGLPTGCVVGS